VIITNADNTETFIKEAGGPSNKAIILLHGIGADHRMWEPQLEVFAKYGFYILAPDLFGHGKSSKVDALSMNDWEYQINEMLLQLEIEQCIIVGVSMGGAIAQSFVINNPKKVSRLVLADTFGELKGLKEKALGIFHVLGFEVYSLLGGKLLAKGMMKAYEAQFAKLARDYFYEVSLKADFDQLALARQAINKIDAIGKIDGDRIPTLVLVGDQFGEDFVRTNHKIAKNIKGSKFKVLKNSMDPSNLVNPKDFNYFVLKFLLKRA
jgi:pimeloyl-ACP methyl ester carboxylesterase